MSTPPENEPQQGLDSRIFVIGLVIAIIGGVASWNACDYMGGEGLDPKKIKRMASDYEGECYKKTKNERACKKHIGTRHRECLKKGIIREPNKPVAYAPEPYHDCLRSFQDEDIAAFSK